MLFNSLEYGVFLVVVLGVYFFLRNNAYRNVWLLAASYYFYASWNVYYLLLIIFTTLAAYLSGLFITRARGKARKLLMLWTGIVANLAVLFYFKYFNFFLDSLQAALQSLGSDRSFSALEILLPVGISFYVFQAIGYCIDVYRKDIKAEASLIRFALFVSFFPQLVAGPIERSTNLLKQFYERKAFNFQKAANGLKLIVWGLFMKVVVADNAAVLVDNVYNSPTEYPSQMLVVATVLFAFQIFGDFAGYSYMAIGSAKVLGFDLMKNFNNPYSAKSIADFWRRWHISLSSWFRDYIYIPLGGSRASQSKTYRNLMIVFLVSGLWHGAAWTFVAWGFLHGAYLVAGSYSADFRKKVRSRLGVTENSKLVGYMQVLLTFGLVNISWVLFRSSSIQDALYIMRRIPEGLFSGATQIRTTLAETLSAFGNDQGIMIGTAIGIIIVIVVNYLQAGRSAMEKLYKLPQVYRLALYNLLILIIIFYGRFANQEFIYFQF